MKKAFNRLPVAFVAFVLMSLMAFQLPAQVAAAETGPDYISEIKVGMAKNEKDAKTALEKEGYKILDCNLNQGAEGGVRSKGKKAVYLGYKTTKNRKEAVTDMAVMNMKGGYKTQDYDLLMKDYLRNQIIPFVQGFASAIKEYRANYSSANQANQTRAKVIHDMLNRLTDDDTGKRLGDLLLNETKFEMGDDAYAALSDEEKKEHADIVTILAQANGQATLLLENLLTRASDTNDNTWIDRLSETTYADLIDATGKTPTDAKKELVRCYDDDANKIMEMWDDFKKELDGYGDAVKLVDAYDLSKYESALKAYNSISENTAEDQKKMISDTFSEELRKFTAYQNALTTIKVCNMLSETGYGDGTMRDFFQQDAESDHFDITCVYPMVASLTKGQRSGLDFVSLKELTIMAFTDDDSYSKIPVEHIPEASVYEGVDRAIYEKGGVGFTSDAIRTDAAKKAAGSMDQKKLSTLSVTLWCVTGVTAAAIVGSVLGWKYFDVLEARSDNLELMGIYNNRARRCIGLVSSFSIVLVIMAGVSLHYTFRDLKNYYKTEFTPQPRFIVEENDVTGYNQKGEKVVLKNQTAYYKLAETNRDESAEFYSVLGTGNDLNGDVGKQWLSLYTVKHEKMRPVLAGSLKAVVGSTTIPDGYKTGIHLFGEDTAFNLNNSLYVWKDSAKSVIVYFKTDNNAAAA